MVRRKEGVQFPRLSLYLGEVTLAFDPEKGVSAVRERQLHRSQVGGRKENAKPCMAVMGGI